MPGNMRRRNALSREETLAIHGENEADRIDSPLQHFENGPTTGSPTHLSLHRQGRDTSMHVLSRGHVSPSGIPHVEGGWLEMIRPMGNTLKLVVRFCTVSRGSRSCVSRGFGALTDLHLCHGRLPQSW
jgi:hypothetical protein